MASRMRNELLAAMQVARRDSPTNEETQAEDHWTAGYAGAVLRRAEHVIASHPIAALGAALAAGVAVGWWVKRK